MRLLAFLILLFSTAVAQAQSDSCQTTNPCDVGNDCKCIIPADSAYDRYFYSQLNGFAKGHIYKCKLSSSMGVSLFVMLYKVPNGAKLSCADSNCQHFPITFFLDTTELVNDIDTLQIKYYVVGSDMPTDLHVNCQAIN